MQGGERRKGEKGEAEEKETGQGRGSGVQTNRQQSVEGLPYQHTELKLIPRAHS